jgi:hypothetical protein
MIERKFQAFDLLVRPVQEVVYREFVRLIDVSRPMNRLQHWANDDVRIDDGKVESGLIFFDEFPRSFLGQFLRCIIS